MLARRGLDRPAPKTEIIPLPSGGVFAEAVLGRFNAAEKIDLTRFWNWQDSPIPIARRRSRRLRPASRAQAEGLRSGPAGAAGAVDPGAGRAAGPGRRRAIIAAIQTGQLFRDMSGLAQTAALAQAACRRRGRGHRGGPAGRP